MTATLKTQKNAVDALYSAASAKHQKALVCIQEAKQLRAQAQERQQHEGHSHSALSDPAQRGAMFLADSRCHVIQRHIGKTAPELKQRFIEEPHLAAASSFSNLILAAEVVALAIERNQARIRRWLTTSSVPRLVVEYAGRKEIGYVIQRTKQVLYPTTRALIILKRDSADPVGYYIVTAYPVV